MKNPLAVSLIVIFLQFGKLVNSVDYKVQILKAFSCDNTNKTYVVQDITIDQHNDQSYVTAVINLMKDINVANMSVLVEKCDISGDNCDIMGKFTIKELCKIIFMKNTVWAPVIDAISPRPECPILKKNTYVLHNSTVNMNDIVKMYPDSTKHHWKIEATLNDVENKPMACGGIEAVAKA